MNADHALSRQKIGVCVTCGGDVTLGNLHDASVCAHHCWWKRCAALPEAYDLSFSPGAVEKA